MVSKFTLSLITTFILGSSINPVFASPDFPILVSQNSNKEQLDELLRQGRDYVDKGNYQQAIAAYKQAASLDNDNAKIFSGIAYLHSQQGNYQAAVKFYQKALSIDSSNPNFYYALGDSLANVGDNNNAASAYYYAIQLNPQFIKSYIGLGVVLLRQEDYEGAAEAYKRVIALDPNNPEAFSIMGSSLLQQKRLDQAVQYLGNAVQRFPRDVDLRLLFATAYLQQNQLELGKEQLEAAKRIDPTNTKIQLKIARIYEVQDNPDEALRIYRRISYLNRKSAEAYAGVGRIQLAQKDYLGAIITYKDLIEIIPQNPEPYYYLGVAFKERNRDKEAQKALQYAKKLYQEYDNKEGIKKVDELLKEL